MPNDLDAALATSGPKAVPQATAAPVQAVSGGNELDAHMSAGAGTPALSTTSRSPSQLDRWMKNKTFSSAVMPFIRPQYAVEAAVTGGNPLKALSGAGDAEAPAAHKKVMDALARSNIGVLPSSLDDVKHFGERVGRPAALTGLGEAAEGVVTNPLSALGMPFGGRSAIARGTEAVERHGMPAAMKVGQAIDKVPGGQAVTKAAAAVHDVLGVHSAAKRELARLHGSEWLDKYAEYRAELMRSDPEAAKQFDAEAAKHKAEAVAEKKVAPGKPPAPLIKPKITAHDMAGSVMVNGRRMFVDKDSGEMLPMPPARIPEGPASVGQGHSGGVDPATGRFGRQAPPLGAVPREAPEPSPFRPADAEAEHILGLMKPQGRSWAPDWLNTASNAVTGGMFLPPLGSLAHEANVTALGGIVDPIATAGAIKRGLGDTLKQYGGLIPGVKKIVGSPESAESIAARHAGAQRGGALSSHDAGEKGTVIEDALQRAQDALGKKGGLGKAAAKVVQVGRDWYGMTNDSLWKFENEVRANRFNSLVQGGMKPATAGLKVGGEMVDYGNRSALAANLKPVAPFINWGLQMPGAVARGAVENPGRVAAAASAFPALFGGTQGEDPDTGKPYKSTLPQAEVFRALSGGTEGAKKYAQGRVGAVPRYALGKTAQLFTPPVLRGTAKQRALKERQNNKYTYGIDPDTFMLNESPILGRLLEATGHGMFQKPDAKPDLANEIMKLLRVGP